jgi:hypothetical protein
MGVASERGRPRPQRLPGLLFQGKNASEYIKSVTDYIKSVTKDM